MPANDKIVIADYNNIRNKVSNVLGSGSGTSGYGQTISSSSVTSGSLTVAASKVTVNEYALLRNDIINAYRHIFGSSPVLASPTEGNLVRYDATGTTPEQATQPVVQYDRFADQLIANRFTIHPSQAITTSKGSNSRSSWTGEFWNNRLSCVITTTFTNSDAARFFFNSGGEIRFNSSRTGGTITRQQNISWSNLLSSAGTQGFGAQIPTSGFSPMNGQNFYRLTNVYQIWYTVSASSPYTTNTYRIQVRSNVANNSSGTATQIDFLVEWIDGYVDPGPKTPENPPPGDQVDGTISISVSTLEASGVLVPVGAGNFTVQSPTVSIGTIDQDPNGPV
jgi:hypothetical protein